MNAKEGTAENFAFNSNCETVCKGKKPRRSWNGVVERVVKVKHGKVEIRIIGKPMKP